VTTRILRFVCSVLSFTCGTVLFRLVVAQHISWLVAAVLITWAFACGTYGWWAGWDAALDRRRR
jgi:hypothetical protein